MGLFKSKRNAPLVVTRPDLTFLGEQDGPIEREFKAALSLAYKELPQVRSAYLAKVAPTSETDPAVLLCIKAGEREDSTVLEHSVAIFQGMFSVEVPLDILFLDAATELRVRRVCSPFYGAL